MNMLKANGKKKTASAKKQKIEEEPIGNFRSSKTQSLK